MKAKAKSAATTVQKTPSPGSQAPTTAQATHAAPAAPVTLSHEQISAAARELWEKRGCPEGQDTEIWFEAERILREHLNTNSADEAMNSGSDEALRSSSEPRPRNSRAL